MGLRVEAAHVLFAEEAGAVGIGHARHDDTDVINDAQQGLFDGRRACRRWHNERVAEG